MTVYVGLLRAVNVGGTGKLPMEDLRALCTKLGFQRVQTYIASGNVLFDSPLAEAEVKASLEAELARYAGKPVAVMVRTLPELDAVLAANPFPDAPGNRVLVFFLDSPPPPDAATRATGLAGELIEAGVREVYVRYTDTMGQGASKLRIPAVATATGRNLNTVGKLAELASRL